ncbi:nitroreductase family protein [Methanosarcinales archaeon]|nr:MAG: nitroreductase family protein [Methanosarcinales archaeon]
MDLYDAIRSRRSVYNFKSDEVADDIILRVLEAGTMAPSAFNSQPWEFILVKDPEIKQEIALMREKIPRQKKALETAPLLLVVCYNPNEKLGDDVFASCFTAIENILLALTAEGLAGVILAFRNRKLKELLGLDENMQLAAVIPIGYAAEEPSPKKMAELKERLHINQYTIQRR